MEAAGDGGGGRKCGGRGSGRSGRTADRQEQRHRQISRQT